MAILVKENIILTDGFVRDKDGKIIPSANVKIKTDSDTPVLVDEPFVVQQIGNALAKSEAYYSETNNGLNVWEDYWPPYPDETYPEYLKRKWPNAKNGQVATTKFIFDNTSDPEYAPFDQITEQYMLWSGEWKRITLNKEEKEQIIMLAESTLGVYETKAEKAEVITKDGSAQFDPSFVPSNPQHPETVAHTQGLLDQLRSNLQGSGQFVPNQTQTKQVTDALAIRINNLEQTITGQTTHFASAFIKYASDIGTPQETGGTATTARINMANLRNDNSGTNPSLNFTDENVLFIKIRGKINGQTGNLNIPFQINSLDAEPSVIASNMFQAKLAGNGMIDITWTGTPATNPLEFPTIVLTQVQQFVLAPVAEFAKTQAITDLQNYVIAELNKKLNIDFPDSPTANKTIPGSIKDINAKAEQNKTDIANNKTEADQKIGEKLNRELNNVVLPPSFDISKQYIVSFLANPDGTKVMTFDEYTPSAGGEKIDYDFRIPSTPAEMTALLNSVVLDVNNPKSFVFYCHAQKTTEQNDIVEIKGWLVESPFVSTGQVVGGGFQKGANTNPTNNHQFGLTLGTFSAFFEQDLKPISKWAQITTTNYLNNKFIFRNADSNGAGRIGYLTPSDIDYENSGNVFTVLTHADGYKLFAKKPHS